MSRRKKVKEKRPSPLLCRTTIPKSKGFFMKTNLIVPAFLFLVCFSCSSKKGIDIAKEKENMKQADIAFSNLSKKKGMKAAFMQYMDTATVLLRPGHYPIKGIDARLLIHESVDSSFILVWTPYAAELASSADMGYTYGVWTSYQKKWLSDSVSQGTYVTIWKKQADGNWKFVLDSGNPGVDKKK